jgi:transcriptional antiterminator RfaH
MQTAINQLHEEKPQWFAIYVAFKKEKYAKQQLMKKGVETYLPLQKVVRQYERKVKKLEIPLINCYLFVRITKSEYVRVLETDYVSRFVKIGKDLIAIPDVEIEILQKVLEEKIEIEVEANAFHKGEDVIISSGNLAGVKGKLVAFQGKEKVVVQLDTIGYALQMEINKNLITKVI